MHKSMHGTNSYRVRFFGKVQIRISDPESLRSWCIKGTGESLSRVDLPVLQLMHSEPSYLRSLILTQIIPKERTRKWSFFSLSPDNTTRGFRETDFQQMWLLYFAYILTFLVSLFGNSVIIHIIRTDNSMKTSTNDLILNQACADLLMTMAYLTNGLIPYSFALGSRWFGGIFGQITCKIFVVFLFFPPFFSIWILVAIAVDRYYAVTQPLRSSPLSRHLKKIIASIWAWSSISSTDVLAHDLLVKSKEHYYCNFITKWVKFQVVVATVNTALPLIIMTVLYTIVCHRLWSREIPGEGTNQNQGQAEAMKTARKVTRMMIVILLLFLLCWFPYNIYLALDIWGNITIRSSFILFLLWLMVAYSGINPYIYLAFNQKFRHSFKSLFGNCFRKFKIRNVVHFRSQSFELEQIWDKTEESIASIFCTVSWCNRFLYRIKSDVAWRKWLLR